MIIDLNVIADGKQKQDKIGEVIFKMNELGMIDSLDFAELINMVNDNLIILEEETEFKNKTIITTDGNKQGWLDTFNEYNHTNYKLNQEIEPSQVEELNDRVIAFNNMVAYGPAIDLEVIQS